MFGGRAYRAKAEIANSCFCRSPTDVEVGWLIFRSLICTWREDGSQILCATNYTTQLASCTNTLPLVFCGFKKAANTHTHLMSGRKEGFIKKKKK